MSALKTFHSSQLAMICMQVIESSTKFGSLCHEGNTTLEPSELELLESSDSNSMHPDHDVNSDEATSTMEEDLVGPYNREDVCMAEESTVGYVNQIALNTKALNEVGNLKVVWKLKGQSQRQLFIT